MNRLHRKAHVGRKNGSGDVAEVPAKPGALLVGNIASPGHKVTEEGIFPWLGMIRSCALIGHVRAPIVGVCEAVGMAAFMSGGASNRKRPSLHCRIRAAQNTAAC